MSGYSTKNYTEQGGEKTVIGGTLAFEEGAKVKDLPGQAELLAAVGTLQETVGALGERVTALEEAIAGLVDGNEVEY